MSRTVKDKPTKSLKHKRDVLKWRLSMAFKIGDKVVVTKEYQSIGLVWLGAKVVTGEVDGSYGLQVDGWSGHNLGGIVEGGGWWVPTSHFKKAVSFKGNK